MELLQQNGEHRPNWDTKQIDHLARLALAPPDKDLIHRLFVACSNASGIVSLPNEIPLTLPERRWIIVNLENNTSWQAIWKQLETTQGQSVPWPALETLERTPSAPKQTAIIPLRAFRWIAAASIALMALYGTLWTIGQSTLPATYTLASVNAYEKALNQNLRGTGTTTAFTQGTDVLKTASQSTFGLFPHYDAGLIEQAKMNLQQAFDETTDPFLRAEAGFFLAKAHLMEDNATEAKHWLNQVLDQNVADYREEASDLLGRLNDH